MRSFAFAVLALCSTPMLGGCRAEPVASPGPPSEPEPEQAVADEPGPRGAAIAPAASPGVDEAVHAQLHAGSSRASAAAPAATVTAKVAGSPAPPRDEPPAGCIDRVEDLPRSAAFDPDDRRLRQGALVVVSKSARRLMLYADGHAVACYRVALGFAPDGHKLVQGDGRTPQGWYRTSDKPWSSFEHAIAIHYPNADDARDAAGDGRIGRRTRDTIVDAIDRGKVPPQATALGGAVLIHGGGSSSDWTLGCVALDDDELVELRDKLPKGMRTDLLIVP